SHRLASVKAHRPLLIVLAVALFFRLHALRWGLPDVLEEATPLRKAWDMWGWGPAGAFHLNPHFFNYPTLTFYLQMIAQALLYAVLRLGGRIPSNLDFRALYVTDPSAFLIAGRLVTVLFAAGTVAVLYATGKRLGGTAGGLLAAGLLAVNPVHLAQSVVVE